MKVLLTISTILLILALISMGFAHGPGFGGKSFRGHHFKGGYGGGGYMMRDREDSSMHGEMEDLHISVLSKLTKKDEKNILDDLEDKSIWEFIKDNKIDKEKYQAELKKGAKSILDKYVENDDITKKQADFMIERMSEKRGGRGFGGCGMRF